MIFKAIIFDMDGVLADTEPFYQEIERNLFERLHLNIDETEHESFKGVAADRMWAILKEKYPLAWSLDELMHLTTSEVLPFFLGLEKIDLYEGIRELITEFAFHDIPVALASSSYPEVIRIILEKTRLAPFFKVVVNSEMAGASKPDPAIFLLAADQLGVTCADCLVIEDSANGIRAAKKAGMYCIAVDFPENKIQDKSLADKLIKNYYELSGSIKFFDSYFDLL